MQLVASVSVPVVDAGHWIGCSLPCPCAFFSRTRIASRSEGSHQPILMSHPAPAGSHQPAGRTLERSKDRLPCSPPSCARCPPRGGRSAAYVGERVRLTAVAVSQTSHRAARVPPMRGGSRRPVQAFPTCNYRRKQRRSSAASPPLLSSSMGHTAFTAQRVMFLAAPVVTHRFQVSGFRCGFSLGLMVYSTIPSSGESLQRSCAHSRVLQNF